MSRPSIRARPLDPQRPLPLIRTKKELEECEGVNKNVFQATEEAEEKEKVCRGESFYKKEREREGEGGGRVLRS